MIDYKALREQCRREGKSTLDLDDLAAGHPVAEAELAELRHWMECRYHGHDYEACEKYSGQVPCDHEALGTPEPDPIAASLYGLDAGEQSVMHSALLRSSKRCAEADCAGPEEPCRCYAKRPVKTPPSRPERAIKAKALQDVIVDLRCNPGTDGDVVFVEDLQMYIDQLRSGTDALR